MILSKQQIPTVYNEEIICANRNGPSNLCEKAAHALSNKEITASNIKH